MTLSTKNLTLIGGALLIAGLAYVFVFSKPSAKVDVAPSEASAPASIQQPPTTAPSAIPSLPTLPNSNAPWQNAELGTLPSVVPTLEQAESAKKAAAYRDIQMKLTALTAGGAQPKAADVDKLLGEIEKIEGTSIVHGVDLRAVRNNLASAEEMQKVAMEMQELSKQGGAPDSKKMQALLNRLQTLQEQLTTNISAPAQPVKK